MGKLVRAWALVGAVACALSPSNAEAPKEAKDKAKVEAKADQHLKQACAYLAKLKGFAFQVDETTDEVQDDGRKLQHGNRRRLVVGRPNRLAAEVSGDRGNRRFVYDGKSVSILDKDNKTYVVLAAPGTIDAMLDDLHDKYGHNQTLADLLFSNPYAVLTERLTSGAYVGVGHVHGVKCHHLSFRQSTIDWQLWVDAGEKPLVRKFLITFKRVSGQPQYTAVFSHWNEAPELTGATFEFKPPVGAKKMDALKRSGGPAPEKKPAE